jgi:threonine dehydratase
LRCLLAENSTPLLPAWPPFTLTMATTTWSCVSSAAVRLESIVHRTPVLESQSLNAIAGRSLFLKCEAMQKTGSFKARGALNAVLRLPKTTTGVVTHSAGNHGQALAWAAQQRPRLGCAVVVPNGTAKVKVDAIQGYGAELHFCEPTFEAREKTMHAIAAERGWSAIPPYNHDDVIAGQGTLAWEMCEQLEELHGYGKIQPAQDEDPFGLSILDAVIVPVSGGGMAAGVALAMKHLSPETKVFCVAPEGKGLEESLRSGKQPGTSGTSGTSGTRGSSSSSGGGGGGSSSSSRCSK